MAAMGWLAAGERELEGCCGEGFLQGILLSEVSAPRYTAATDCRIVMFDEGVEDRPTRDRARTVALEVPWDRVCSYWTGVMPFPPDMWRQGPEGEVIIFTLDPSAADGRDLVVWPPAEEWTAAARSMGVPELID
ncbi:MAG: hypothetical protein ACRD0S_03180 [Acidimicrobiales bacterium]